MISPITNSNMMGIKNHTALIFNLIRTLANAPVENACRTQNPINRTKKPINVLSCFKNLNRVVKTEIKTTKHIKKNPLP